MMKRSILNKTNGTGEDATATTITTTSSSSSSSRTATAGGGGGGVSETNTGSSGDPQTAASNRTTSTSPFSGNQNLTHEQMQTSSAAAAADETKKQKKPLQFLVRSLWNSTVRGAGAGAGGDMTTTKRAFLAFLLLLVLLWTSSSLTTMTTTTGPRWTASIGTDGSANIFSTQHLTKTAPPMDIGRKAGTPVILNIGSNLDPIVPRPKDDPCTVALAFEPIVGHQILPHPSLHVIHAAVSYDGGWSAMNLYNKDGRSSSLNEANHLAAWSNQQRWNKDSKIKIVPTISFRTILESLEHYDIQMILTDMQGHDFKTVSSVGDLLVKVGVRRLVTEVYKDNVSTYKDSHNDLCLNWLPYMTSIGYVFEGLTRMAGDKETLLDGYRNVQEVRETCAKFRKNPPLEKVGVSEYNAYWRLKSEPVGVGGGVGVGTENKNENLETHYFYGTHSPGQPGHVFSKEAYEQCRM